MNTNGVHGQGIGPILHRVRLQRGLAFGILILTALLAFEVFNYSTTDFALTDLLGDLQFLGVRWATILAIAFCGIDFAGIARLFTPEEGADEPGEVWYLFGAWLLAATMNAMLTWWGVSLAVLNHETLGNSVIERTTLLRVVPIFVAVLVWLIRVLIIGTFSVAGDRLFSMGERRPAGQSLLYSQPMLQNNNSVPVRTLGNRPPLRRPEPSGNGGFRPAPKPSGDTNHEPNRSRQEPTYHPVALSGREGNTSNGNSQRNVFRAGAKSSRR